MPSNTLASRRSLVIAVGIVAVLGASGAALSQQQPDVPYVPTPWNVVDAMLEIARVGAADNLLDLGAGDGRIVIEAARKYGTRGTGIELDANLVSTAKKEAQRLGVASKASFAQGNLFNYDLGKASVLTMYLLPNINAQLRPRIFAQMQPGARVVSHDFDMGQWKPDVKREISVPDKSYGPPMSKVYLWYVPAQAAGKWIWRSTGAAPRAYEAMVNQTFQELSINASVDGAKTSISDAQLQGNAISFALTRESGDVSSREEFSGRIEGDTIVGRMTAGGGSTGTEWQATRIARGSMNTE